MKVLVAGASGAVGIPIVKELIKQGHEVAAMTRSERGTQELQTLGAKVVSVDAFDYKRVKEALHQVAPEVVIDMLTYLPKNLADMPKAFASDRKLRLEGGGHLFAASVGSCVSRYLRSPADSGSSQKVENSSGQKMTLSNYRRRRTSQAVRTCTVSLRSGYSAIRRSRVSLFVSASSMVRAPGTPRTVGAAEMARQQRLAIVGKGSAVNSFVHVDDAAKATVATLIVEPGVYNIVDDDPVAVSSWLPAFAASVGAPPPPQISEETGAAAAGPDAVFYHNNLSGASNAKAKKVFGFEPRPLEWLKC